MAAGEANPRIKPAIASTHSARYLDDVGVRRVGEVEALGVRFGRRHFRSPGGGDFFSSFAAGFGCGFFSGGAAGSRPGITGF